jgi:AraC-like DNA-binding protein
MSADVEPMQSTKALSSGGIWIEGKLGAPPEGVSGPMVFGPDWLLEMLQSEGGGSTLGLFWAPFAIIRDFPNLVSMRNVRFVGFSMPTEPPAEWLTSSMTFDLGDVPLAGSPQEFIALIRKPRPYLPMEGTASLLSKRAKSLISSGYRASLAISEVARHLGVSHAHLSRQFRQDFGLTPIQYLHRLRVSEAIGRLAQGEKTLDVGYDVGFNDTTRFYKDFRKVTGTSPAKCRSRQQ